ncbi:MAG: ABC transporter permease [Elusimicrobia bacterium]|nr:ABC transporter permease [Elusimicrobiota bacterium]
MAWPWDLFWTLARTEFKLRDQGTWMGFCWTLLQPLGQFAILYAVFSGWLGAAIPDYAAYLLVGLVPWNFFATASTAGLTSLRRKAGLVGSHPVPRLAVVWSAVAAVWLSHLAEWALLAAALAALGKLQGWGWLLLPGLAVVEALLAGAVACALAVPAVQFRDLERAWGLALYALFFLTPVFFDPQAVQGSGAALLAANPLSVVIGAARAALLGAPPPPPASLALVAAGAAAATAATAAAFPRWSRGVAESL